MKSCNPTQFTISLGGLSIERGYADGEFFRAEPQADTVQSVVGTDGEVAVSVSGDQRWDVTIRLLETSDENMKLTQLYNLKKRGSGATGMFPFLGKDADTGEVLTGTDACVVRPPTLSKDRTATVREWKLLLCNGEYQRVPG